MPVELSLRTIPNAIDQAGSVRKLVENVFFGGGYNAYNSANQLRADDQLIRNEVSGWLGQVRKEASRREADYREQNLTEPTRDHPFPDRAVIATVGKYEKLQREIESVETSIRDAAVPANDRVWQRHRNEVGTAHQLIDADLAIASAVVELLKQVADPAFEVLQLSLDDLTKLVRDRASWLSVLSEG